VEEENYEPNSDDPIIIDEESVEGANEGKSPVEVEELKDITHEKANEVSEEFYHIDTSGRKELWKVNNKIAHKNG